MTSTRKIYESLSFIAATWPKDKLRPDASFGASVLRAAERSLTSNPPTTAPPPQTSGANGVSTRLDSRSLEYKILTAEEGSVANSSVEALRAIMSGQASKKVRS
jgi:hypothetical protein